MTRHYVLRNVSQEEIVVFLKAYKKMGYLTSASLAQHFPPNGEPHFHVIVNYVHGAVSKDPFISYKGCHMIDDIRCHEALWRDYLSENGKTPIIDI